MLPSWWGTTSKAYTAHALNRMVLEKSKCIWKGDTNVKTGRKGLSTSIRRAPRRGNEEQDMRMKKVSEEKIPGRNLIWFEF